MGRDPGPDPDANGMLRHAGMKVLHVPDVDYRTTAPSLVDALKQVRSWSQRPSQARSHLDPARAQGKLRRGSAHQTVAFRPQGAGNLEAEILSVFPPRRDHHSGRDPRIVRDPGRGGPETRLARPRRRAQGVSCSRSTTRTISAISYLEIHPALHGQLCFASVAESHPQAAWFKINDPVAEFDRIRRLVGAGFLVRTRADADTRQARSNNTTQRDMALASGAQFISTDYPEPDRRLSPYCVQFTNRVVVRGNPVSGKGPWNGIDLEASNETKATAHLAPGCSRAPSIPWHSRSAAGSPSSQAASAALPAWLVTTMVARSRTGMIHIDAYQ